MMPWYALYIKSRHEKKVATYLDLAEIQVYCPLEKKTRQWSDRLKVVETPVFRGYVFVNLNDPSELWKCVAHPSVVGPVKFLGEPAVIRDGEIRAIKRFLDEYTDFEIEESDLKKNNRVKIRSGILMDYEGIVMEVRKNFAIVRINSLGLQLKAKFDKKKLRKIV